MTENYSGEPAIVAETAEFAVGGDLLRRRLVADACGVRTVSLAVGGTEMLASASMSDPAVTAPGAREFSFRVRRRLAEAPPAGIAAEQTVVIETIATFAETDALAETDTGEWEEPEGAWSEAHAIDGRGCLGDGQRTPLPARISWAEELSGPNGANVKRFVLAGYSVGSGDGAGELSVTLAYETYANDPAIRKTVSIRNDGHNWLKLEALTIDDIELVCPRRRELTPSGRGARASVIAYGDEAFSQGLIACSEVPSALREMELRGGMGYNPDYFEWALGPGETFVSEGVLLYAYAGDVFETPAGRSEPLDRTIEGPFAGFLRRELDVGAAPAEKLGPVWCTWTNFAERIDDAIVREQAGLAERAGFRTMLIDCGWQRGDLGTDPDPVKFPDFAATADYIRSRSLQLGLWVSVFRDPDSRDLAALPDARCVPLQSRVGGYGMSFASPWRHYYARDLADTAAKYGAVYFKQDFTSIKFGDIAAGHDSRTRKESLLRALRGLLEAQAEVRRLAPGVVPELTHEIYWGTPGTPCDLAALRHAGSYHVPPNDYSGAGHRKQRHSDEWPYDADTLRAELLQGCFNARQRLYEHRALPLYCIVYYGAASIDFKGSLTREVQDRQVCSWLMGAPLYAGDLSSLSEDQLAHYRSRYELVGRLERQYGIFRHFQFSGVPAPTDSDWHWWGKLNPHGEGAVVVLRGHGGEPMRAIAVPWAAPGKSYSVSALFGGERLGIYTGEQLRRGAVKLELGLYGQEILELGPA